LPSPTRSSSKPTTISSSAIVSSSPLIARSVRGIARAATLYFGAPTVTSALSGTKGVAAGASVPVLHKLIG
jgi:hypothetical protein